MGMGFARDDDFDVWFWERERLQWHSPEWVQDAQESVRNKREQIKKLLSDCEWQGESSFPLADKIVAAINNAFDIEPLPYRNWRTDICLTCDKCNYKTMKDLERKLKWLNRLSDKGNLCTEIAGYTEAKSEKNTLNLIEKIERY